MPRFVCYSRLPWKRPTFFDTEAATLICTVEMPRARWNRVNLRIDSVVGRTERLYKTERGLFFRVTSENGAHHCEALGKIRTRRWLFRHVPVREVFAELGLFGRYLADA